MAQKSLPILNKVNVSMIWYSTFYYKHYRWLSSQYLYLLYFFNKLFVFLDLFFATLVWTKPYTTYLAENRGTPANVQYQKFRFLKPVTSYLFELNTKVFFLNVYYSTSLENFQAMSKERDNRFVEEFETFPNKIDRFYYN
jgi:hypothetical protein